MTTTWTPAALQVPSAAVERRHPAEFLAEATIKKTPRSGSSRRAEFQKWDGSLLPSLKVMALLESTLALLELTLALLESMLALLESTLALLESTLALQG